MKLFLARDVFKEDCTLGRFSVGYLAIGFTVEDVVRDEKIYGETAIPAGTYNLTIDMSPHFGKLLPLLLDVPGYEGVRIHSGNTAADTKGCIIPGLIRTENGVAKSRDAMDKIQPMIQAALDRGEEVTLTITDER